MIAIDLSKQEALNADPKAIQQIIFTENLAQQATIFFVIEEVKETVLQFWQRTVESFTFTHFAFLLWYKMTQIL